MAISCNGNSILQASVSMDSFQTFTVEFWMRSDSFAQSSNVFSMGRDSISGFGLNLSGTLVPGRESYGMFYLGGISTMATGNALRVPFQQWIHVAIVRSANAWKVYRNGTLVGRCTGQGIGSNDSLLIGEAFKGELTRLRLWKRDLDRSDILASMGSEAIDDSDLISEYTPQETGIINSIPDRFGHSGPLKASGKVTGTLPTDFPTYSSANNVWLSTFPSYMQFFARDSDDTSRVIVAGTMIPEPSDSLEIDLLKNDSLSRSFVTTATSSFLFTIPIHCELSQYTIQVFVIRSEKKFFVAEAADLLSGDVFLIDGQSNAHPAIPGYSWQNVFCRTIGVQTDDQNREPYNLADTLWGLSSAAGDGQYFSGPYLVGSWARWMEEGIASRWSVPTCVINGAAGGSAIAQHFRNDQNPTDSTTIYGRMLYRIGKSGLAHSIKAFFWYQGEWDSGGGYMESFRVLHTEWLQNYSGIDSSSIRFYVFQTRPDNCGAGEPSVREAQREIPDSVPNCVPVSTVAIDGYDGCHYYWNGYVNIGQDVLRKIGASLYHSSDSIDVDPPNIAKAHYTSSDKTEVMLLFRTSTAALIATPDTVIGNSLRRITDAFYL
ncbi:MAG TPA: LamG domain-containing protein, partial [Candidatus Kapabacteria bacterium]